VAELLTLETMKSNVNVMTSFHQVSVSGQRKYDEIQSVILSLEPGRPSIHPHKNSATIISGSKRQTTNKGSHGD